MGDHISKIAYPRLKYVLNGEKSGIIDNVYLKDSDVAYFEVHIDTDDANAFLLKQIHSFIPLPFSIIPKLFFF